MKCAKCKKPIKENTDGNTRYCQGHSIFDNIARMAAARHEDPLEARIARERDRREGHEDV